MAGRIVVTALPWVPDFARGQVRDLRVRWALEEAGLPYEARLVDKATRDAPAYRQIQPFGQVPALEIDGESLFESGAILLKVAEISGCLLPAVGPARDRALCWLFAALSSVEPSLMNLAEVDFFMDDEGLKARRRPAVLARLKVRLDDTEAALPENGYLAGEFTVADLMLSSVLRIVRHTDILATYPRLSALGQLCEARPAFRRALEAQLGDFAGHGPAQA